MSEVLQFAHGLNSSAERRKHARQRPNSLTYIELDKENGGIVLDASESGISVQAVVSLNEDVLPRVRLRLPDSNDWLEFRARVVWARESRKVAGLEFEELSEHGRSQLHDWLAREATDAGSDAAAFENPAAEVQGAASNSEIPSDSRPAEVRPALVLVDYTDQSGAEELHMAEMVNVAELAGDVRGVVPAAVAAVSEPAARTLSVPFSGIFGAQERARRVDAEVKQLASAAKQQVARSAASPRQTQGAAWVYVLLLLLAAGSATAGWAAGRGKLAPMVEKLRGMVLQERASAAMVETQPEKTIAPVSEIVVMDVTGQRRTIALQTAAASAAPLAGQLAGEPSHSGVAATNPAPAMNFQVWTLSAPRRSASSGAAAVGANSAPPAMPGINDRTQAPQIAQIAAGDATNAYAVLPKPENSAGVLQRGALLHRVEPEYPEIARDQRLSGTVVLDAHIGTDGSVRSIRVISGPKLLTAAAENAVREWRYAPTFLDGSPIETDVQISLAFHLPGESQ
ncbi:MAG TPA: TonB family protein [Candidatus Dormibacteraeota bacterium]|nr:TonB family protein [Candidatus Dormibacteraeota bacterium]